MNISATIITFNEAENIKAACESVAWADEILVVDSESTDNTREIAEKCGVNKETQWDMENVCEFHIFKQGLPKGQLSTAKD